MTDESKKRKPDEFTNDEKRKEVTPYGNPKIDFDEASKLWSANKRLVGMSRSVFEYCCGVLKPNGEFCKAPPFCWSAGYLSYLKSKGIKYDPDIHKGRVWGYCKRHIEEKSQN